MWVNVKFLNIFVCNFSRNQFAESNQLVISYTSTPESKINFQSNIDVFETGICFSDCEVRGILQFSHCWELLFEHLSDQNINNNCEDCNYSAYFPKQEIQGAIRECVVVASGCPRISVI